ncbi:MFS transporter [Vibrio metschnikovii]|uniref:MFS transporter n=2 Tax=Vibrio metschnikovii TaxID=28172 RepID=UPI0016465531|nr:MFS transporter [Vibrio metschnikovii]EKO3706414.1 MFS transporter [Vibrio metschnikovii]EKO3764029.1 MFS transporter [Vibrio metschnikovii]
MSYLKSRPIRMIFLAQLLICASNYVIVPFLAVYLTQALSFSLTFVGTQVAIKLVSQRGFMIFGGMLTDTVGPKKAIFLTLALRIVAILLFFYSSSAALISIASLLLGVSTAIFVPASKVMFTTISTSVDRVKVFSLRSMVNNIGIGVGSLIGSALINSSISFLVLINVSLAIFSLLLIELFYDSKPVQTASNKENRNGYNSILNNFKSLLSAQNLLLIVFLSIGSNAVYVQIESIIPLYLNEAFDEKVIGYFFAINSLVIIFLQLPLNSYISSRAMPFSVIALGFLTYFIGMLGFAYSNHIFILLIFAAIYTLGEIFIDPYLDTLVSNSAPDDLVGTAFGLTGFGGVIGGLIGSIGSTWVLTWIGYSEYWIISGLFALAFAASSTVCRLTQSNRRFANEQ